MVQKIVRLASAIAVRNIHAEPSFRIEMIPHHFRLSRALPDILLPPLQESVAL